VALVVGQLDGRAEQRVTRVVEPGCAEVARAGTGLQPVAPVLECVGGQVHPLAARQQRPPVDRHAAGVQGGDGTHCAAGLGLAGTQDGRQQRPPVSPRATPPVSPPPVSPPVSARHSAVIAVSTGAGPSSR